MVGFSTGKMDRRDACEMALRVLTLCVLTRALDAYFGDTKAEFIKLPGDIIVGGLFPMHEKGTGGRICGAIKEHKGIQRVEAMLYAIDKINSDPRILPNITLGVHILDTCLRDTYALEQSLEFIMPHMRTLDASRYQCASGVLPDVTRSKPVAGVIGAAASPVSIMVANILRLFKVGPRVALSFIEIEVHIQRRVLGSVQSGLRFTPCSNERHLDFSGKNSVTLQLMREYNSCINIHHCL